MEINFDRLKEQVAAHVADILRYNKKKQNLEDLDIQIIGLCDTFKLISPKEMAELREPVVREKKKLEEKLEKI